MHRSIGLITLLAALAGCGAPAPDATAAPETTERGLFRIQLTYDDGGLRRGSNSLHVRAWDASGAPATLAEVTARMPSHDHGLSYGSVSPEGQGFAVDDLRLTMSGRWEITFRLAQGGRSDVALVDTFIP